jgi:lysophospholipase L1-like esterase
MNKKKPANIFERHPKAAIIVIVFIFLIVVIAAFEKYLAYTNSKNAAPTPVYRYIHLREQPPFKIDYNIPRPELVRDTDGLVDREYRMEIDSNGFIYPSKVHDNPDVVIVFLGGSTTQCTFVDEKNRFPYLAGRILEEQVGKVNSYNSGMSGNHSLHSINALVNKVMPLKPDVVVMMHNINDLGILLYEGSYWNDHWNRGMIAPFPPSPPPSLKRIAQEAKNYFVPNLYARFSELLNKSSRRIGEERDEWEAIRGTQLNIDEAFLTESFADNLRMFISLCRIKNITPVLMTQANRLKENPDENIRNMLRKLETDFGITYSEYRDIYNAFNETIRRVGEETGVLVIDLAVKVPQEKDYMYDGIHFNDNGSKFVAGIIAEELLLLIKEKPGE